MYCPTEVRAASLTVLLLIPAILGQDSTPGGPVHDGQPDKCNGWHTVVSGDDCQTVAAEYGLSLSQFLQWNPAVSSDCIQNFWLESAYCVRVGEPAGEPSTTSEASTTSEPLTSTSWYNSTYSTQFPVTSWNITATTVENTWPPTKTIEGESELCNSWHRARPGDTCQRMVNRYGLRLRDFISWNPGVEEDCDELIADYRVCIGVQSAGNTDLEWEMEQPENTPPPEPTEYVPEELPPVDSSFVPSPSHGPMPSNCRVYHLAAADENCNTILAQYGYITREQFFKWNPALNNNCLGLWLDTFYCVGAFDDNLPPPPFQTDRPTTGNIPHSYPWDCSRWYHTSGEDTCEIIAMMFGSFSVAEFIGWNPTVLQDCSDIIGAGAWYCVGRPDTPTSRTEGAPTPTDNLPGSQPIQSGTIQGCTDFWLVGPEDDCDDITISAGISLEKLYLWNSQLVEEETCDGLEEDYFVCVGVDGDDEASETTQSATITTTSLGPTSSAAATTTSAGTQPVTTPQPVREGMAADCVRFYLQQVGDLCYSMAEDAGISLAQFYEWNPAVGTDCANLWPGYYYCIGISGPVTTISEGPPVPT